MNKNITIVSKMTLNDFKRWNTCHAKVADAIVEPQMGITSSPFI